MIDYRDIIKNRELRLRIINLLRFIPDEPYLKLVYRIKTGRKLNLKNPVGFNEKLNWLKLHDRREAYTQLVDKLAVRDYITKELGSEYLFPLLGSWDHFDEIDFDALPDKFVLKCSHDSGSVKLITNKADMDKAQLRRFFEGRLGMNPYYLGREYPYKTVPPRILAEQFMESPDGKGIRDYKFHCFNGEPKMLLIVSDRYGVHRETYFDMDFQKMPIVHHGYNITDDTLTRPETFEEMKAIARQLAKGSKMVRVDLYEVDSKIYFGELTYFVAGGFMLFEPDEWEKELGDWIRLED